MRVKFGEFEFEGTPEDCAVLVSSLRKSQVTPEKVKTVGDVALERVMAGGDEYPVWTEERDAELLKLLKENRPWQEIASIFGKTQDAVKARWYRLSKRQLKLGAKLRRRLGSRVHKMWSAEEDAKLRAAFSELGDHPTYKQLVRFNRRMARELRRSVGAVQVHRTELGLVQKERRQTATALANRQRPPPPKAEFPELKGPTVEKKIVEMILRYVVTQKTKLKYEESSYVLGISSIGVWRDFLTDVLLHSQEILNAFEVGFSGRRTFKVMNDVLMYGQQGRDAEE